VSFYRQKGRLRRFRLGHRVRVVGEPEELRGQTGTVRERLPSRTLAVVEMDCNLPDCCRTWSGEQARCLLLVCYDCVEAEGER